jgi:hypothetical protein
MSIDIDKIFNGVLGIAEAFFNPAFINFSDVYAYLNFFVFVGALILSIGLTKPIENTISRTVAVTISVVLALAFVANKEKFPIIILSIAALSSLIKLLGGFCLCKYLVKNIYAMSIFLILIIVIVVASKFGPVFLDKNYIELIQILIIIFSSLGTYRFLADARFPGSFGHHYTLLGLTILIGLTSLIDFSSVNLTHSSSFLNSLIFAFFSYTFITGFLAGFFHYFMYER